MVGPEVSSLDRSVPFGARATSRERKREKRRQAEEGLKGPRTLTACLHFSFLFLVFDSVFPLGARERRKQRKEDCSSALEASVFFHLILVSSTLGLVFSRAQSGGLEVVKERKDRTREEPRRSREREGTLRTYQRLQTISSSMFSLLLGNR